jgi:hypothetical protein
MALFELEILGGPSERRYRKMRPEVEAMPWGTLDLTGVDEAERIAARRAWTSAAYQEHRTAVGVTAALRALLEANAPLDLIGLASRFPLDETVHVELCARMAMEAGGGTEILYQPDRVVMDADPSLSLLMRAADLVVRFFCVGEALSIPLIRGTCRASRHPLPRAILSRILKDEAAHGTFGFLFLDWAAPLLDEADRIRLAESADLAIQAVAKQWDEIRERPPSASCDGNPLAWLDTDDYLKLAARSMNKNVLRPLREYGIPIRSFPDGVVARGRDDR